MNHRSPKILSPNHFRFTVAIALIVTTLAFSFDLADARQPSFGKYSGKTGSSGNNGRISFKVRGRKVKRVFASAFVLCTNPALIEFLGFQLLATRTNNKAYRLTSSGRFRAKGQDDNGVQFDVKGKCKGTRKFKGTVVVSQGRTVFDVRFFGNLRFDVCAGTREWSAKR